MKTNISGYFGLLTVLISLSNTTLAAPCTAYNTITKVTNTSIGNYDYVIFSIKKSSAPAYTVNSVTPPFYFDPSGNAVSVNGSAFKKIQFTGVEWMCSIPEVFQLPKIQIKDIKRTGQFEGVISYTVGYSNIPLTPPSQYITTYNYNAPGPLWKVVMKFKKN
ncbi:AMIN-like domain-containing (lipo)protein [Crenothrix polyspora]|uniref:AMIN-like domain-containing protein n=1 Tax=Crenothrix polyspora TaxID=360316 RepID=A0A1R4HAZ0_9GAMM|nr:hypothetical protein [Crenothrix polyspora]SJM93393.1 exported hypothetical protein [Crenothrix polyspora]